MTLSSDVVNKVCQFIKTQQNVMKAKQEVIRAEAVLQECRLTRESVMIDLRNADGLELEIDKPTYLQVNGRVLKIPPHGSVKLLKISK